MLPGHLRTGRCQIHFISRFYYNVKVKVIHKVKKLYKNQVDTRHSPIPGSRFYFVLGTWFQAQVDLIHLWHLPSMVMPRASSLMKEGNVNNHLIASSFVIAL